MEDANPHDYSDDTPPLHPNCRCGMVGSGDVSGEETDGEDVPFDEMPPEETPDYETPSDVPEPEIHDTTSTILDPTQIISDLVATTSETQPITFETIADARSWFEGNQIEFDEVGLKKIGMNPSILETVANAIQDANVKSPGVIDELEFIGKKVGKASKGELASVGQKVNGPYELSKSRLYFPQSFVNLAKINNVDEMLAGSNQVTATSISDIITHEMGHVIQNMTRDSNIGWRAADSAMQNAITDAMKIAGVNPKSPVGRKWIAKNISTYANKTPYEFHSEAQVLFNNQTRFDNLTEEVRTFLLEYQKALNTTYGPNFVKTINKATEDQTKERVIVDTFGFTDETLRDLGILN
jgi:hypothetical protein